MNRLHTAADRLWYGSVEVARRTANRITAWCRASPTSRGSWVRIGVVVVAGWIAVRTVRAAPGLLWVVTAGWVWAACRAGRDHVPETPAEDAHDAPAEPPDEPPREQSAEAVRTLLLDLMGDAHGVHLSTVLAHLKEEGQGMGWKVGDLRSRLEALDIPVEPKLKLSGVPTRGVRKDALLAPSPTTAPVPPPEASTAA